ncbi:hypothetical protein POM88_023420 [Heracleum sosnowskyi]|uniref:Major facilitator superfamily (MFS) profile domain-containing protein n=1 Tax=Heracleum sosnowskyi TaxID=360622 RepID=A0AAD8IH95_9APIA|nr:hypothetical protein POM88_023420 [Heracleum sosnowskyi]
MINLKHMDKLLTTKGVTAMPDFLRNSSSCVQKNSGKRTTFLPSYATRKFGRKRTMLMPRIFFQIGVVFNAIAINLGMFIFGKLALGHEVGFANQAVPLILSKIAPTRVRGALNILFQLNVTIGIFSANMVNFVTTKMYKAIPSNAEGLAAERRREWMSGCEVGNILSLWT